MGTEADQYQAQITDARNQSANQRSEITRIRNEYMQQEAQLNNTSKRVPITRNQQEQKRIYLNETLPSARTELNTAEKELNNYDTEVNQSQADLNAYNEQIASAQRQLDVYNIAQRYLQKGYTWQDIRALGESRAVYEAARK